MAIDSLKFGELSRARNGYNNVNSQVGGFTPVINTPAKKTTPSTIDRSGRGLAANLEEYNANKDLLAIHQARTESTDNIDNLDTIGSVFSNCYYNGGSMAPNDDDEVRRTIGYC